jgi:hypothetical protein
MKYAIEIGSSAMIYIPSFIKIGSGIQKFMGGDLISLLLCKIKLIRLKIAFLSLAALFTLIIHKLLVAKSATEMDRTLFKLS